MLSACARRSRAALPTRTTPPPNFHLDASRVGQGQAWQTRRLTPLAFAPRTRTFLRGSLVACPVARAVRRLRATGRLGLLVFALPTTTPARMGVCPATTKVVTRRRPRGRRLGGRATARLACSSTARAAGRAATAACRPRAQRRLRRACAPRVRSSAPSVPAFPLVSPVVLARRPPRVRRRYTRASVLRARS